MPDEMFSAVLGAAHLTETKFIGPSFNLINYSSSVIARVGELLATDGANTVSNKHAN